jgi:hypothetical protein
VATQDGRTVFRLATVAAIFRESAELVRSLGTAAVPVLAKMGRELERLDRLELRSMKARRRAA